MHIVIDDMRTAEKCRESALRIEDQDGGRMIDIVVLIVGGLFLEIDSETGGQLFNFLERPRDAEIIVPEIADVLLHELRCVALRIHADQDNSRQRRLALGLQFSFGSRKNLQRGGADIGAMRKAEEHEVPLTFEYALVDRRTVLVLQDELRHGLGIRQDEGKFRCGRRLHAQGDEYAGGQRQAHRNGDDELSWVHKQSLRS